METEGGRKRMSAEEIEELLELRNWTRTKLAAALDLTENTVHQWISGRRVPGGPAVILMRMWIAEEKEKRKPIRNGKHAKATPS